MNLDENKLISSIVEKLNSHPKYNFLFGNESLKKGIESKMELVLSISKEIDYDTIANSFVHGLINEVLKYIDVKDYDITVPLIVSDNLYYLTNDKEMELSNPTFWIYSPFIKNTQYFNLNEPIADLENRFDCITIKNNRLILDFEIFI